MTNSLQTVPGLVESSGPVVWLVLSIMFNLFFTIDAVLRIVSYQPPRHILRDPFLVTGVLCVAPFWTRVLIAPASLRPEAFLSAMFSFPLLRIFESLETLRLLTLCRYYEGAGLLWLAVKSSAKQLGVPLFLCNARLHFWNHHVRA